MCRYNPCSSCNKLVRQRQHILATDQLVCRACLGELLDITVSTHIPKDEVMPTKPSELTNLGGLVFVSSQTPRTTTPKTRDIPSATQTVHTTAPVPVSAMAAELGVDIRVIHGHIRRGKLKALYVDGSRLKHVYPHECRAAVGRKEREQKTKQAPGQPGDLMVWDKGDGRQEVGVVTEAAETHSTMRTSKRREFALTGSAADRFGQNASLVFEEPEEILRLVSESYTRRGQPELARVVHSARRRIEQMLNEIE